MTILFCASILPDQISWPHVKWAVSLVIADPICKVRKNTNVNSFISYSHPHDCVIIISSSVKHLNLCPF